MVKMVSLPPTSIFMRECWQSDRNRCLIGRKLTVRRLPVAVKRYSHQKKNLLSNSTLSRAQPAPKATLMHILFIVRPSCTPRPPPGRGSAPYGHCLLVTHRFTFTRSEAKIITINFRPLHGAAGDGQVHKHAREWHMLRRLWPGGLYGCGPRPWRPSERSCTPLVASAWQEQGQREGRRGRQNVRMRRINEPSSRHTFVGGPCAPMKHNIDSYHFGNIILIPITLA